MTHPYLPIYFKRSEFKCKCGKCDCDAIDWVLFEVLMRVRDRFGPTIINSGHRCPQHNLDVGGADDSKHLLGKAADIDVVNYSSTEIYDVLDYDYPDRLGLILYRNFVHVDSRRDKYRDIRI